MSKRQPDFTVAALNKRTDMKANIGGAWVNEDGSISVILNGFVKLEQEGRNELLITLFPSKKDQT